MLGLEAQILPGCLLRSLSQEILYTLNGDCSLLKVGVLFLLELHILESKL